MEKVPSAVNNSHAVLLGEEFGPSDLLGPFQFLVSKPINTTERYLRTPTLASKEGMPQLMRKLTSLQNLHALALTLKLNKGGDKLHMTPSITLFMVCLASSKPGKTLVSSISSQMSLSSRHTAFPFMCYLTPESPFFLVLNN